MLPAVGIGREAGRMHTVMVLGGGFALLTAMIVLGRALGAKTSSAALAFVPVWFIAAGANMWVGVTRAGYSVAEDRRAGHLVAQRAAVKVPAGL